MLSIRNLLRLHRRRTLQISSLKFSEQSSEGANRTQNGSKKDIKGSGNAETSLTEKAASDVMRNLPKTFKIPKYNVATEQPNWKEVELTESEKEAVAQKQGLTVTEVVDGEVVVRKAPTYDVAWPEVVAGEVQVKDSAPVPKMDVAKKLKGVGVWDIGTEDHPYRGHSNTAPYPVPTSPPPLGPSRLETWRSLGVTPVPQLINKPPDPSPGVSGKVIDAIADHFHGNNRELQPRHLIMENTDHRSITHYPPRPDECNQAWYEDPAEETTMGFPVIRKPHPFDRVREGIRIKKSRSEDYPYIQDFKNHYDFLIVGGGLVGSMIAYMLTTRMDTKSGVKIGIIEKDPSYRYSLSTCSPLGIRMQSCLPETIEASLFGSDFLRNLQHEMSVSADTESEQEYLNQPNIKFQPHGHLTLAADQDMQRLIKDHEMQKAYGVQSALLTVKQLNLRFPFINTTGVAGAILGLESEGWMDNWNLLQAVKLRNIHNGVDYIHGEVIYMKQHHTANREVPGIGVGTGRYEDGSQVPLCRPYECHILLPGSGNKKVYPIEFSQCCIAAGGESGNVGRMAGIGEGTGPLSVEIPVERVRQYVYQVHSDEGPGLNLPLTCDPSGLFIKRQGHSGDYLVGLLPRFGEEVPSSIWGDADPAYWEEVVLPQLQSRFEGFKHPTLKASQPVDYDVNYYDGSPILGRHPIQSHIWMACGFRGLGAHMAPAIARGLMELIYDKGFETTDLSRFAFDRILTGAKLEENFLTRHKETEAMMENRA